MSPKEATARGTHMRGPPSANAGGAGKGRSGTHFVYVVLCSDGTYYAGYTTDPARRLREHNSGAGSKYTRGRIPVKLAFLETARSRGEALRREKEIKMMNRTLKAALVRRYQAKKSHSLRWVLDQRATWLFR